MDEILTLAMELLGMDKPGILLEDVCHAAEKFVQKRLRDDVVPADCGRAYYLAVASIAAKAYNEGFLPESLERISIGDLSLQRKQTSDRFITAILLLLAPYLKDGTFCFLGV